MMHRSFFPLAIGLLLVAGGCKSKGPVPESGAQTSEDAPKVGTTEVTGAHPGAANPHTGTDPHAGLDMNPQGGGAGEIEVGEDGMLDVGAVAFKVPAGWQVQSPKSSMRRAQLVANGPQGPAELVVYYFGPQGAGGAQENIDRWVGQFTNADGSPVTNPEVTKRETNGLQVTRVEASGQYSNTMGQPGQAAAPVSNQRLVAAIVATSGGPYYFKLVGPDSTVVEHRGAMDALLASVVAAP